MAHHDIEDEAGYNERRKYKRARMRWTTGKVIFTGFLFGSSIAMIFFGLYPLFDGDYEPKSFANLLFVIFHVYYMFSFSAVNKNYQFLFWAASFLVLDAGTALFLFYEDIFF